MTLTKRGTRILTIGLLITLVFVSGCILDFGRTKLDFGNSDEAQKALSCFCQTYGDPATYNGPPRLIAPLVSTELRDNIPRDKVTRFSTDTKSIFFWVIYQNFQQGDDLHLSWIFRNNVVTTISKKTGSKTGVAVGEFVRPDTGWPVGTHTIKIEGEGNSTRVAFEIANGPPERTVLDFTGPEGVSCSDLMTYIPVPQPVAGNPDIPPATNGGYWISGRTSNPELTCNSPGNTLQFVGNTGRAVTPGTPVQLKLFNVPDSGTQDIPPEGIPIGSANTKNDGGWEYPWNGHVPANNPVPYMLLRNNQEYLVKALLPDGAYSKMNFIYRCPVPTQYLWVSGGLSNTELSCDPSDNTIQFSGSTYIAPTGTPVQLILLNAPDSGTQDLPPEGIFFGSTNTRNDGSYEYTWDGNVPGYLLKNGQDYSVKAIFPDSGLSAGGRFRYMCTATNGDYWISGRTSSPELGCFPPNYTLQFMGNTGATVTMGTAVQLKLFNGPDSGTQDLPPEGILFGSTNTKNDRAWEYTWTGYVPGYRLRNGQEYSVKAMLPEGTNSKVSFVYQCSGLNDYNSISGQISNSELSCDPPNNTIQFSGNTYPAATPGTLVQLKLFDLPDAGIQEILIGSTNTQNDGSYEYTWDGNAPGYLLKNGQDYSVKAIFPDSNLWSKQSFRYVCTGTSTGYWISGGTSTMNPVLSCSPPHNTILFLGNIGPAVTPGTPVQLKLFHLPDSDTREILLGDTNSNNDRTWEYTWDGNVPGYSLRAGPEYGVKAMLPDGTYTKMGFSYECPT